MKTLFLLLILVVHYFTMGRKSINETSLKLSYIDNIKKYIPNASGLVFYIDLSLPPNTNRFFVINLKDSSIVNQGLVLNGRTDVFGDVIYSNIPESNCSSKGLYKIGTQYTGKFGKSFKLHGLQKTNNNAFKRAIVLHSYNKIPRNPNISFRAKSKGCPTVNPDYLKELSYYIHNSKSPIMLYIQ